MIRRPLAAFATTIGFCLVLLVSACSNADAPDGPAMWKLETEQTTIYFLGSFHLLDPDLDWRDDRIEHALNEADAVFFEIDDREANEEAMQQEMIRMSMLPPGESLKAMLDPQVYADLEKTASRYGLDVGTMDGMKPWFVAISLSVMEMLIQGHSPDAGVDKTLFDDAEARGIPIRAFETVQEQLEIIDSLSRTDPNVLIVDTLRYLDEDSTLLEDMVQAWLEGDFIPTVQQRGAAIIEARGLSSAASAANAAIDHVHDWVLGTPEGDWVSMAIPSDGSYGVPEGLMSSFPVTCSGGTYSIVQGLDIDEFSQGRIDATVAELSEERDTVAELGLI